MLYEKKLTKEGVIDEKGIQKIRDEIKKEVDESVDFARKSPQPEIEELYKDIFA